MFLFIFNEIRTVLQKHGRVMLVLVIDIYDPSDVIMARNVVGGLDA